MSVKAVHSSTAPFQASNQPWRHRDRTSPRQLFHLCRTIYRHTMYQEVGSSYSTRSCPAIFLFSFGTAPPILHSHTTLFSTDIRTLFKRHAQAKKLLQVCAAPAVSLFRSSTILRFPSRHPSSALLRTAKDIINFPNFPSYHQPILNPSSELTSRFTPSTMSWNPWPSNSNSTSSASRTQLQAPYSSGTSVSTTTKAKVTN